MLTAVADVEAVAAAEQVAGGHAVDVEAVVAVVAAVADAEQVAGGHAVDVEAVVVVAALVEAGDLLVQLHLVVCMTDKCGSTTAYIVLHNSMDYYMLDIGSFKFLLPLKRGCLFRAIGK